MFLAKLGRAQLLATQRVAYAALVGATHACRHSARSRPRGATAALLKYRWCAVTRDAGMLLRTHDTLARGLRCRLCRCEVRAGQSSSLSGSSVLRARRRSFVRLVASEQNQKKLSAFEGECPTNGVSCSSRVILWHDVPCDTRSANRASGRVRSSKPFEEERQAGHLPNQILLGDEQALASGNWRKQLRSIGGGAA